MPTMFTFEEKDADTPRSSMLWGWVGAADKPQPWASVHSTWPGRCGISSVCAAENPSEAMMDEIFAEAVDQNFRSIRSQIEKLGIKVDEVVALAEMPEWLADVLRLRAPPLPLRPRLTRRARPV